METIIDEREHEETLARALQRAGGTRRLLAYTLESHPSGKARAFAAAWLERRNRRATPNAWISGPTGTGKTGLAWSIVRELTELAVAAHLAVPYEDRPDHPRPVGLFVIWRDLLDDLRQALGSEPGEADPRVLLRRAKGIPVLVLDDLGSERATGYALEQLAILVDHRYQQELPTIVTSNYGIRELAGLLGRDDRIVGARIVSRLAQDAVGVVLDGPSLRLAASA